MLSDRNLADPLKSFDGSVGSKDATACVHVEKEAFMLFKPPNIKSGLYSEAVMQAISKVGLPDLPDYVPFPEGTTHETGRSLIPRQNKEPLFVAHEFLEDPNDVGPEERQEWIATIQPKDLRVWWDITVTDCAVIAAPYYCSEEIDEPWLSRKVFALPEPVMSFLPSKTIDKIQQKHVSLYFGFRTEVLQWRRELAKE